MILFSATEDTEITEDREYRIALSCAKLMNHYICLLSSVFHLFALCDLCGSNILVCEQIK